jgi:hypothetical protein
MFQLNKKEFELLKSTGVHGRRGKAPFVFTKLGVAMEKKYDKQFKVVFDTLRDALIPALENDRKKIGIKKK